MLKKTMTYEDFNGKTRTDDFYFNLTKAECAELEFGFGGDRLSDMVDRIVNESDIKTIIDILKKIILMAYGVKSTDGKRFIKNDQLREEFSQTNAYSDLFMSLAFDANEAASFIQGIANVSDEDAKKVQDEVNAKIKTITGSDI